ncbi:hypothetical protein LTR09_009019 [Extremus antarcticus]|uniref:Integral membrane protein n=1 Tax=Extremus antarcticus TaxID=702011 RepID=A0AAJ0D998_9PEZI|nr:hypothetical protein LTR09_009019 [Extremus antarcticus]
MRTSRILSVASAALLLGVLPLVVAYDDDGTDMKMDMGGNSAKVDPSTVSAAAAPPNYFRHAHYDAWIYAHIGTMILAWCFVLPLSLMLSVARSRYHLPGQVVFHIINGVAVFTGFVYNHSTPDLYKGNSHHPIGWVATSFTIVWTLMSFFVAYSEYKSKRQSAEHPSVSTQAMAEHNRWQMYSDHTSGRSSRDSGHGTECNSPSLWGSRHHSQDSIRQKLEVPESPAFDHDQDDTPAENNGLLGNNRVDRFISISVRRFSTPSASKAVRFSQIVLEKLLLLIGFLALATGFVVWGGLFRGREVFSGAAHFVKGAIFFWYGILTLGRWMGAFCEFGWAWNIRPAHPLVARWKTRIPSAEFTESFVIWLYGTSNVFMEHMDGKTWSHKDFEHVSITLLFFGGGLLGMVIESPWARELANTTVALQREEEVEGGAEGTSHFHASRPAAQSPSEELWELPKTYRIPMNPMPGLVIMLLGIMMSSHHQESMVSTMMHSQWGTLFCGFAMARAVTYVLLYIQPPSSHYPSRPPSELVAAFCLTAGGLMFMFSARDSVNAIEAVGLDAMTVFTVTMGLAAVVLAWEIVCFALKGWAVRKERAGHVRALP